MRKIRVGFVGGGPMGQVAHISRYAAMRDEVEMAGLAERRPRLAAAVAARYGIGRVYPDHRKLIDAEKPDAVVAVMGFGFHAALVPELYGAVRFLLTEKPLALSVEAGERLAEDARKAGCVHMVGYHKRSDPAVERAMETIGEWRKSGRMGALKYVRILMPTGDWIAEGFRDLISTDEPLDRARMEGAVPGLPGDAGKRYAEFVNYYIHQVNMMRHLLGEPYRVAYAERSGVMLAVLSSSGVPGTIEMTPYRTTVEWEEEALACFEKGYLRIKFPAPLALNRPGTLEVYSDAGDGEPPAREFPSLPWVDAMRRQAENFVRTARGEAPPPCDAAEALEDLRVARDYIMKLESAGGR